MTDVNNSLWPVSGSQNWTKDIKLDKSEFHAGKTYSLRAQCGYSSGQPTYYYDALLFTVLPNGYVAMGDSYSSGEGSFNYDLAGGNCHRSTDSYAYYLVDNDQLEPPLFTACSGAVTDDLFAPNTVNTAEDAQIAHLTSGVDVVTLTIGGNDAAFSYVVNECADYISHTGYSCSNRPDLQSLIGTAFNALGGTIPGTTASGRTIHSYDEVLRTILNEAPDATVYIAGYPRLFGGNSVFYQADPTAPGGYRCELHSTIPDVNISITDARWLNDQVDQLNHLISYAVEQIDSNRLFYVPATTFDQHGLCDAGSSYINGVVLNGTLPQSESLHPNTTGMDAYGYLLAVYMGLA